MTVGVYGIFDATTNECLYVGQSKEIEVRFRQHITKLKNKRSTALKAFVDWYHDHGAVEDILTLTILDICENDRLLKNRLEAKWFDELSPKFFGKIPSLSESWDHSPETKHKIAESIRRSKGNLSGVSKKKSVPKPRKLSNDKKNELMEDEKYSDFDIAWKAQIIKWYTVDGLSCREISRRMGKENKIKIPNHLRRYGIEVKPRTFNNQNFSSDSLDRISRASKSRSEEKAVFITCIECNRTVRIRPSSVTQRFCSKSCRWDYDSEHCEFPNAERLAEEILESSFYIVCKKYRNQALMRRYLKNHLSQDHPVFNMNKVSPSSSNV